MLFGAIYSVGRFHVAALTGAGDLFTWGSNDHGQLALPASYQQREDMVSEGGRGGQGSVCGVG